MGPATPQNKYIELSCKINGWNKAFKSNGLGGFNNKLSGRTSAFNALKKR